MDAEKHEHLIAHYSRWRDLGKRLEHGLAEMDESTGRFRRIAVLGDELTWQHPQPQRRARERGGWRLDLLFHAPSARRA
jgi:hypothetical protein